MSTIPVNVVKENCCSSQERISIIETLIFLIETLMSIDWDFVSSLH